ncbi:hypothetical protein BC936DRAFT_136948 [Jimgerdemannia flammicorona]|uniref:Uncharacterized protein n=1 Tax=Jimgerdemannia flammicorona TaxID=994334 RepID=A0A433DJJ7_9FUNG|nr:hypothetical protein BC936DRAFT_136948 [Jimgerdemannia flammicorona]
MLQWLHVIRGFIMYNFCASCLQRRQMPRHRKPATPDLQRTIPTSASRYSGNRHPATGAYHGRGTLHLQDRTRFEGRFVEGKSHDMGKWERPREIGSLLFLCETCRQTRCSTRTQTGGRWVCFSVLYPLPNREMFFTRRTNIHSTITPPVAIHDSNGVLDGPATEYVTSGLRVLAQGEYVCGRKVGVWMFGLEDDAMIDARYFPLPSPAHADPQLATHYHHDPSTHDRISRDPLLPDPYERRYVEVRPSTLQSAGEGLFVKVDVPGLVGISFMLC